MGRNWFLAAGIPHAIHHESGCWADKKEACLSSSVPVIMGIQIKNVYPARGLMDDEDFNL